MTHDAIFSVLGNIVIGMPMLLVMMLGGASLFERRLSERLIVALAQICIISGLAASLAILTLMLIWQEQHVSTEIGKWVLVDIYHFTLKVTFDRLSVPFVILTFVLCGTIGAFTRRYLHRERGFHRFFVLYSLFLLGVVMATLAGTIETLFTGWELVGLSSAMLVAYFHERPAPVRNGLRVWSVYRVSDAALLIAAVVMHHIAGHGDFDTLFNTTTHGVGWPQQGLIRLSHQEVLLVGTLLLVAAAGKSALVPFSGWLPRAMEGPTPSSAVFYGALSVHLGAYLLLRFCEIIESSLILRVMVITLGLTTAALAALIERVQTDIKSDLAMASLTQVGIIVAEIGLGFRYIALVHILGHACFRTLQFLRAPTILHDYKNLENALGSHLSHGSGNGSARVPSWAGLFLYRLGIEKGCLDVILADYIATPLLNLIRACDRAERRWTDFLSGEPTHETGESEDPFERLL